MQETKQEPLRATVRSPEVGVSVIDIHGDVNASGEDVLMSAYTEATVDGIKTVVLNFSGLEYMNSGGIGLLVTVLIRAQRQGLRLLAWGLNSHYRQIFELTRLDEAIGIYESEEAAVAASRERRRRS